MAEPTEDQIDQVVAVIDYGKEGEDRAVIIQALKSHGGDLNGVVGEWYENNGSFQRKYRQQWDESMFGGEREGPQQGPQAYHVEAPYQGSEVIQGVEPSQMTAPSRPPSRNNNQAFDRVAEWTTQTAGVPDSWDQENNTTQEDRDMEEAIRQSRESAQAAGIEVPQQESGVTGIDASLAATSFGPATREYYDQNQWAMVAPAATMQTEIAPSKRERKIGAPAFLVEGPTQSQNSKLGAYLTILHEIPLARNLLLKHAAEDFNYGVGPQWWKGDATRRPHNLGDGENGELEWRDTDSTEEASDEIRRLMGFLDSTTRGFATIGSLIQLRPSLENEKDFHQEFQNYFKDAETAEPFVTDVLIEKIDQDDDGSIDDSSLEEGEREESVERVHSFELQVAIATLRGVTNLYGLLDNFMWSEYLDPPNDRHSSTHQMALLKKEAEVFAINLDGFEQSRSFDIPETFYGERWLVSRKQEAQKIMREISLLNQKEMALHREKHKVYVAAGLGDKRRFLARAQERFEKQRKYLEEEAHFRAMEESEFDANKYPDYHMTPLEFTDREKALDAKLKEAIDAAQTTLEIGRRRSEEIIAELNRIAQKRNFLSRLLTDPDKKGRPSPMTCKKYLLQGIATGNNIVYVCRRARENLIELSDAPQQRDEWWRLQLDTSDMEEPVKAETLDFESVTTQIWKETKFPMLVYATEAAARAERTALPAALERFVKADNKAFQRELNDEQTQQAEQAPAQEISVPFSPTKRKHRGSNDSMDSNRPSIGSVDGNASDGPFSDEAAGPTDSRAQKRQSPGAQSSEEEEPKPPPLPKRHGSSPSHASTEKILTTVDEVSTPAANGGSEVNGAKADVEMKTPEMQQRPQASIFLNRDSKTAPGKADNDMDIDG